tara:strand:- start:208 stop:426 length:219 start_codon:yes stop_codon:yes gene_type:complete
MSNQINDGGPAFGSGDATHGGFTGMSLRDYFAAQVIASEILLPKSSQTTGRYGDAANYAYKLADAMIERRQR